MAEGKCNVIIFRKARLIMKRRKTAAGLLAASLLVGAVPVVTNAAPVRIVSTSITEQSSSGYRVNVTFSADAGVSRVMMPT